MEKIEIAALSKIADILSNNGISPIYPEEDIWKKIFYNAEQGELFEEKSSQLKIKVERYGYGDEERNLYHNEKTYNALLETFEELADDKEKLVKLLNSISNKISLYRVLIPDYENKLRHDYPKSKGKYLEDYFNTIEYEVKN